jgi:hypothetical protein
MADYNLNSFDMENTFSSWLDGTLSPEEETAFMDFCASNPEMQEIMEANDQLDETYEALVEEGYELPTDIMTDFIIPQVGDDDEDKFPCDELLCVDDADNADDDNQILSAHVSEEDYEQADDSYDDFAML